MWPVHSLFLLPHWFTFRSFQGLAQCLGLRAFSPWRSAQTASDSHSICHAFHPHSPCDYLLIILQVQLSHTHACLYESPHAVIVSCCCCYCSVTQSCLTLCDPMDRNMPEFPVPQYLPVCSNSFPLSRWYHPTISSSVALFSSFS